MVLAAAVQLVAIPGDVQGNLAACERLGDQAGVAGAKIIALPEFFPSGMGFLGSVADAVLPPDGPATELLTRLAARYGALVGGSFLCRDADGEVRNAYLLADPSGIVGRHDKDLPTMWENALYIGGDDDGVLAADGLRVGAAVCWELMRTQTARRLRGNVDLLMTGSGWWSMPDWPPTAVFDRLERRNTATARTAAASFGQYVGAPIVHAAHAGDVECPMPWLPLTYRGHFEGATLIAAADGTILAERRHSEGEGVVLAEITPGATEPELSVPSGFWLHPRGALPSATWHYQRWHGRRWYRRNMRHRAAVSRT